MKELQELWDKMLVQAFYYNKSIPMKNLNMQFKNIVGSYPKETGILRTTKYKWQYEMCITRFIASCLPKLSSVLYNHDKTKAAKIIEVLQRSKIDTVDDSKELKTTSRERRTLFDKSAKEFNAQQTIYRAMKEEREKSSSLHSAHRIKMKRVR